MDLIEKISSENIKKSAPLASKMRPEKLDDFLGQRHILDQDKPLYKMIKNSKITSMILWGPPGSGKTTLGRIISSELTFHYYETSAVLAGVKDLREMITEIKNKLAASDRRSIIFVDEIHRFNKAQQDVILPHVENGLFILIGSTTENPSFYVNPALRSRCMIYELKPHNKEDIVLILRKAAKVLEIKITDDAYEKISSLSSGDMRVALNILEGSANALDKKRKLDVKEIENLIAEGKILYDKMGDEHFDHLSAFQKSMRGSDPDAAIYWLGKMIAAGEDPRIIARRMVVTAAEDVGNADPLAFLIAEGAARAVEKIGFPESRIILAQAVLYIANASKSNSTVSAIDKAIGDIENGKSYRVPPHIQDSHYKDAKKYGRGTDYFYSHKDLTKKQDFLPKELQGTKYYTPKSERERKVLEKKRNK